MTALPQRRQGKMLNLRVTPSFKKALENATVAANLPTITEFIKQAIMEKAERHGVKIDRYR